ncbi:importin-11 [Zootermopsis nevadensis]|uniref:Importin-11 n=1 Tax=Zootermopsis nevadensis TaxID=136037 RepID=A0A067QZY0_ZOONE|nr:importin-11 [Zootermopsis nevadensis]XP_021928097.1 importin-11 [Zootermopsis nevadensis]XP_021928098.1 importin-11 [Zootermopsis nevadensis]XP_021928099.1 importin-11 [Zootermopsis nevadensis]XP_021928100.1 importin-11 [Zootermopsis nevadensis]XP_021928102.1 importin-11 [Zootermopsis nevadensis]KDR15146.1 Importin-11 [Zootermopsis nevadensis]
MDIATAQSMVLETLQRAANQNAEILKPAELKLKEWETEPGFYSILLNIFSNHSIDVNVRWLAVLYFKNGVDRYWRKTAPNALSEAEKTTLRQGLVSNFREPINQIATQLAVLISKVARFDCPREWPELVPTLLTAVKSEDPLVQHRTLLMLHHVIKTLSSKRLAGDRRLFQELTSNVFSFVLNLWNSHVENFLKQVNTNSSEMGATLEKALLALRILRKLTVHGFKKPHESADAVHFLNMVFDRAKTMLECRKTLPNRSSNLVELSEKFIIHLTKVLIAILEHHPFSYVDLIQPSLEFAVFYVFTPSGESVLFERFIIQCLNLIKGILLCAEYKPAKIVEETKELGTLRAHQIKMTFFTADTLTEMCRKLVTHYFLLTRDDLELWDSDPESFATDEGGESWKYSLRPCTESLFLALFHEFRVTLSPVLLEMIQNNHALVSPSDLSAILRKDAVYNAVGLAAFDLYDEVNFDQWFSTTLTQELNVKGDNYRVIRRRVVWLIGQWTGVKLSPELRPALYAGTLPLLQGDEDMAVRLTASNTLKLAIDDFEFNTDQFLPFLEPSFALLFTLLKEAHECDTKMHVLYVLSFIVERVGFAIRPYSGSLIQYLPLLWEESAEHNMLRCAIVSTLVHLVKALGTVSENLSPFLLPVIQLSTDVHQDCHVYLLEDGLELWLAVLENSSSMSHDLLHLFRNMPPLLEYSSENLRTCFYIIQANILLSPEEFLNVYGEIIVSSCSDMLSDMRSEGIVMTMRLVEMCLRASPNIATDLVKPMLPRIFEAIYQGEAYPMVMSMYLSIMARILLCSRDVFSQVIAKVAQGIGETPEVVLNKMLDVWLDKMALVTQLERRKLLGLALASLLTAQSSAVLERFCGVLLNVTETLNDIIKTDDMGIQIDSLLLTEHSSPGQDDDVDYETEHDHRRKQLAVSDPVHTIALRDYFQAQMSELQNQVGASHFEQLMQTVDIETMEQVREYVVL